MKIRAKLWPFCRGGDELYVRGWTHKSHSIAWASWEGYGASLLCTVKKPANIEKRLV